MTKKELETVIYRAVEAMTLDRTMFEEPITKARIDSYTRIGLTHSQWLEIRKHVFED